MEHNNLGLSGRQSRRRAADQLIASLIKARAEGQAAHESNEGLRDDYFLTRLRARIHERRAQSEVGLWESMVAYSRGWLLAFGLIASLLILPSFASLISPAAPAGESELEALALTGNISLQALESLHAEEAGHDRK